MVGEFLIAQAPVLPELERSQQRDDCTEGNVPASKYVVAGVAEDERRGDQPEAKRDGPHLLPALQCDIFELGQTEDQHADHERIEDHGAAFGVHHVVAGERKPRRYHDQHAKQHAEPVFPRAMLAEETKARHCRPPLEKRHTSAAAITAFSISSPDPAASAAYVIQKT